jgi:succinoglycan biosynthesis transport protein ExoP
MSPNLLLPPAPSKAETPAIAVEDILYTLFRHKWRILVCTTVGLLAAAALYYFNRPPYQSEAMLFIRYVVDNGTPGSPGSDAKASSPDSRGDTIISTEVEILRSLDVAYQVADAIGPDKILAHSKGPKSRDRAAYAVQLGLVVEPLPLSSVIRLVYKGPDAGLVQPVLGAIVESYLKKHVEVHRGIGTVGDFLFQETDQLHSRLTQTEDALRKAKDQVGITSVAAAEKTYTEQTARIQQEIYSAEAELAEGAAALQAMIPVSPVAKTASGPVVAKLQPSETEIDDYRNVLIHLQTLQKTEQQMAPEFTDKNQRLRDVRDQIVVAQAQRRKAEQKFPSLLGLAPVATTTGSGLTDLTARLAYLAGLRAKIQVLNSELAQTRSEGEKVNRAEGSITELQRQKELAEVNYRYYSEHLEGARIDEALGAGRALNIAVIQAPSPPHSDWLKTYKSMALAAFAGLGVGVAWAFLIELFLDHSVRRPADIERRLGLPLFLSMPDFGRNGHDIHVFHDTLRDRLIGFFESRNLTHKPKLVAVTGVGRNSGVTSTAAGLARSLSETGEGNVLLVDMTAGRGSAQQFFQGKVACGLDELLETRANAQVEENLYVVAEEAKSEKLARALPSRFHRLMPRLKASNFDYIIFDMPPVNQISLTPRLAGLMDMVLLVVESERTDRDLVRQAVVLLSESQAHVGAILNRTRNYLPSKKHHEFLGSV